MRPRALLVVFAGAVLGGCILFSRFDDVSGGAVPDAADDAARDSATDEGAPEDAGSEAAEAEADAGPGCACANETIVSQPTIVSSLAVDDREKLIYWTTEKLVQRCPTAGCPAPQTIADAQAPSSVTVGVSHVAWVGGDSAIWLLVKSQIDGGAPVKAAHTVAVSAPSLKLDDSTAQSAIVFLETSWLYSCPAAAVPNGLPNDCDGTLEAYGLSASRGLVFDGKGYYFIAAGGGGDRVYRCRAGGCGNASDVLAATVGAPQELAQDKDAVYWVEGSGFDGGAILGVPKTPDAGAPTVVAGGLAQPDAIAADDSAVYFTDLRENAVKVVAKDGGVSVIAPAQPTPRLITLDSYYVYWANQGDGTIRRASKCARCP
jgi:hypothetical protein